MTFHGMYKMIFQRVMQFVIRLDGNEHLSDKIHAEIVQQRNHNI